MRQLSLGIAAQHVPTEAYEFGARSSGETHGVVLTKPHVVELILDLVGYTSGRDLASMRLWEPSCGTGAFLGPVVVRLLESLRGKPKSYDRLKDSIRACDIDPTHVQQSRTLVASALIDGKVKQDLAQRLAETWISHGDSLLAEHAAPFDFVVGNPPYVRIEQISPSLQRLYRTRYETIYDRADLYVAFIERGLELLTPSGRLGFVCADRWTSNKYGAPLRRLIAERFHVHHYVDLHQASPFESEVIAYPSIFSIGRKSDGVTNVARLERADPEECAAVGTALLGEQEKHPLVNRYPTWFRSDEPWVIATPQQLTTLRMLEANFPTLEEYARVGIGVATGCDSVYIVPNSAPIEKSRKVPLVMRSHIEGVKISDAHMSVVNTFDEEGKPILLDDYPLLKAWFGTHRDLVRKRHVAETNPRAWFRTIDRVYPELVSQPKLLIPDIAGANEVAFDPGRYHPHHNLYFVTSDKWDLEVMGGLLSSRVALFFIWAYAVKMRGGYLRFQAQYLRRIRLPAPNTLAKDLARDLAAAFRARDFPRLDSLALKAYQLKALPDFAFVDTRS
ncbi:MAG: Eco57I restriction-modification methylase domain-containing protein [Deltaproteobacteria bacterium]|nr:Eco57I restriction-modification methylase domain-containing protein [Deltaproteobacteria bacterium]